MFLLIVDDEVITRQGIYDSISWNELSIDKIMMADDGISGMEIASKLKPDIVLTDVRMPCMDGIEMSRQIRRIYPDCKVIFMSGYSDKEYLLSAIQLKAISYIEKPINRYELQKVLEDAVRAIKEEQKQKLNEVSLYKKLDISMPYFRNGIAVRLLDSRMESDLTGYLELDLLDIRPDDFFITVIVKIVNEDSIDEIQTIKLRNDILEKSDIEARAHGIKSISAFKDNKHMISHLSFAGIGNVQSRTEAIKDTFLEICKEIKRGDYFIGIGKQVKGIWNLYESYITATIALQKGFYRGYGAFICSSDDDSKPYFFEEGKLADFTAFLENGKSRDMENMLFNLALEIRRHENTLMNYVKDIFFKFMLVIDKYAQKTGVKTYGNITDSNYLWEMFTKFHTLAEVLAFCESRITEYFDAMDKLKLEKSGIIKAFDYIKKNYYREDLSIRDISSNSYFSPAYLCTIFKHQTGKTINEYITEYRIDKSMELLSNKGCNILDIAKMVGYSDSNYFSKLFKKYVGMTPKDYREKVIS